jgi:hypothetical protein
MGITERKKLKKEQRKKEILDEGGVIFCSAAERLEQSISARPWWMIIE